MAVRNDTDHQYVNGSLGTVRGFTTQSQGGWPIVEFENGNIVTMKPNSWQMQDGDTVLATVKQVPLRCAWAITIHKSQGMTLDRAVMDLRRTFAPGMDETWRCREWKGSTACICKASTSACSWSRPDAVPSRWAIADPQSALARRYACLRRCRRRHSAPACRNRPVRMTNSRRTCCSDPLLNNQPIALQGARKDRVAAQLRPRRFPGNPGPEQLVDHAGQSDQQPKRVALQELKTWNRPRDDHPYHHAGQRNRIERLLPWQGNQRDAQYGQAQADPLVAFGQHFRALPPRRRNSR